MNDRSARPDHNFYSNACVADGVEFNRYRLEEECECIYDKMGDEDRPAK